MKREDHIEVFQNLSKGYNPWSWYWRLKEANSKIVTDGSEGYSSKGHVLRAVKRLQVRGSLGPHLKVKDLTKPENLR